MNREIIFDTETTGINSDNGARLVEIAAIELIDKQPTGRTFHHYIDPEMNIPPTSGDGRTLVLVYAIFKIHSHGLLLHRL